MDYVPLEANPDSFNSLASVLGLDTAQYSLHDILGLDDELLDLVPQPVEAVIALSPAPEHWDAPGGIERDREAETKAGLARFGGELVYFRQRISNACGTIALLHALANSPVPLRDGPIKSLFESCRGVSDPEETARMLSETDIVASHCTAAQSGQSIVPNPEDPVPYHFAAFVAHNGELIELDGYGHAGPFSHGPITNDLLHDVARVFRKKLEGDPGGNIGYNLMALAPAKPTQCHVRTF